MALVLIVDDDLDYSAVLEDVLVAEGHQVRTGHTGAEGLRIAHERQPDVVLLDIDMPVLSGPEMAYEMFVRDSGLETVPLVLLSGSPRLKEFAARIGTPYFRAKPFRVNQLLELVGRALAERIAPQPTPSW